MHQAPGALALKLRAVFFDLDDTLIPSERLYREGLRRAWRALRRGPGIKPGARPSWTRFLALYRRARGEVKRRLGKAPAARSRLLYFKALLELLLGRQSPRLALELLGAYESALDGPKAPRVRRLAAALSKRYVLGIITNQICRLQLKKLRGIDPDGSIFRVLVSSEELGVEKPDPRIFREACRRAGCRPAQALMAGNSRKDDVLGARRAGLRAVRVAGPAALERLARELLSPPNASGGLE